MAPHIAALITHPHNPGDTNSERLGEAGNRCVQALLHGGLYTEAVSVGEALAAYAETLLGTDHPDTLTSWGNLASSYQAGGRTIKAIAFGEQVANQSETVLGADHPDTLTSWANLAVSYQLAGQPHRRSNHHRGAGRQPI
mgnify:FL=1